MAALTPAEKQKAYRERLKARAVAERHFDGEMVMTLDEFLEVASFDEQLFYEHLEGLGEETAEHEEEEQQVWQEAYDDEFSETFDELLQDAVSDGFDLDEDDDGDIRSEAYDLARESADAAVTEWRENLDDYHRARIQYDLVDLLSAYRAAMHP